MAMEQILGEQDYHPQPGPSSGSQNKGDQGKMDVHLDDPYSIHIPLDHGEVDVSVGAQIAAATVGVLPLDTGHKKNRGRPKGSKNQVGHKAGRPKRDAGPGGLPSAKRLREESERASYMDNGDEDTIHENDDQVANATIAAQLQTTLLSQRQQEQDQDAHHRALDLEHLLPCDIPVDPSLTNARDPHSLLRMDHDDLSLGEPSAQSVEEAETFARDYVLPVDLAETTSAAIAFFSRAAGETEASTAAESHAVVVATASRVSKLDKGKGIAVVVEEEEQDGLENEIRRILLKDFRTNTPRLVTRPYQLHEDGTLHRIEGPPPAHAGPVYVYLASYESEAHSEDLYSRPSPLDWKKTHPLNADGKPRARGPRRCGYCGKHGCKGSGGRNYCSDYLAGVASTSARLYRDEVPAGDGTTPVRKGRLARYHRTQSPNGDVSLPAAVPSPSNVAEVIPAPRPRRSRLPAVVYDQLSPGSESIDIAGNVTSCEPFLPYTPSSTLDDTPGSTRYDEGTVDGPTTTTDGEAGSSGTKSQKSSKDCGACGASTCPGRTDVSKCSDGHVVSESKDA